MDKDDLRAILHAAILIAAIITAGIVSLVFILCLFHMGNPFLIGGLAVLVLFGAVIAKGLN